jgi:imidazolonepropionase-like amidohydrolase
VDKDTRKFWQQGFTDRASEYELQKKLARIMFHSGAKLLSGTDCLNSYVLAGFSLHEELEELVRAGLSQFEALKTSTVNAAEFLKREQETGTIEVGKIADLLLLEDNPLQEIRNTRKIQGVMIKGKWFNSNELDNILRDVKENYSNQ